MKRIELASRASTRHPSKAFKLLAAQGIQPLVTGRVLHKSGFVAESVIAVLSHAVEVRLVLSVVAASEAAILVEPESHVAFGHGFIFKHSHAGLQPHLLLLHVHAFVGEDIGHRWTRPLQTRKLIGCHPRTQGL